ncbi:MAG TPA: isoprenyl synthetase [Prolixibacteraceae bacterium]|jgi:geranylgeranyl diphosphate synthase type II|nr:isoprenyl synthetase [Prolixibacteraceae bacterium]
MHTIKDIQKLISEEILKEISLLNESAPKNLYQPIAYTLAMGGKRLRPVMVLLACNLFTDQIEKAIPAAVAIEAFHNFTLLHDDIMDEADVRRNCATVHKKYNRNIAILSGDAMSIMAYRYLQKSETADLGSMFSLFSQTALEVCEGQQLDMDFETVMDVSIPEYLNMIRLKTAVLLACSLKMGALAANAPERIADLLYAFGINLGIAFQLQDDLLDVFADQKKFGKKIGGDIVSNKKTFLLLKALELSAPDTKKELLEWIDKKEFDAPEKIKAFRRIYTNLNIKEITINSIEEFYQSAINIWNEIDLGLDTKSELLQLAHTIMDRDH